MKNRYYSFTPVMQNISCGWFVDGSSYMSTVADALESATQEIFIADWWLSPEIHMKRPTLNSDYWRLDTILLRKAVSKVSSQFFFHKKWRLLAFCSFTLNYFRYKFQNEIAAITLPNYSFVFPVVLAMNCLAPQKYPFVMHHLVCFTLGELHSSHSSTDALPLNWEPTVNSL